MTDEEFISEVIKCTHCNRADAEALLRAKPNDIDLAELELGDAAIPILALIQRGVLPREVSHDRQ